MDHSEKSLCEKSMKVVVNIIRLSSFSIAQKTLGVTTTNTGKDPHHLSGSHNYNSEKERQPLMVPDHHNQLIPAAAAASRRSQQPQSRANTTYVINGSNGSSTAFVVHKKRSLLHDHQVNPKIEQCVDGLASDYIFKIRNKLERAS